MSGLIKHVEALREGMEAAAKKGGRRGDEVTLVAVTKTFPPSVVTEALAAGLYHLGENKVQEARTKREATGERGQWHLIGHLQTNKVKVAARIFDWVESVDSLELATLLNESAAEQGRHLKVLLQVNISGEGTKCGVSPDEAPRLVEAINPLSHLELRGLMTIAPFCVEIEKTRPVFAGLRELRDKVEDQTGLHLPDLSMGMSHDYLIAIEEGATMIRVGSALFGSRPPAKSRAESAEE